MKTVLTFIFFGLISLNAMAIEICSFKEISELDEYLQEAGIKPSQISKNHKRFRFVEKQMIHHAVSLDTWASGVTREDALNMFYAGEGVITYYSSDSRNFAIVRYWPGDNEYGAIYEMGTSAYKVIARINDSFIECK